MAKEKERAPEGRPLQFSDLSDTGKSVVQEQMNKTGKAKTNAQTVRSKLESTLEKAEAKGDAGEEAAGKARQRIAALDAVEPRLKDKNITLRTATNRRVSLARAGVQRAEREAPEGLGGGSRLRAVGAGWYYDHRADLDAIAAEHGLDEEAFVTASAVMSPQNSPDKEKAAAAALAHLHSKNPLLTFSPTAQRHLGVGATARFSDLTNEQAAGVGTADLRSHIGGVDESVLLDLAKGGTKGNVTQAVGIIRGTIDHRTAIDPHSAPKVWSYRDSILKAKPGTAEHQEYLSRADNVLFQIPGQQRLDLWGLKDSTEGMLSPTKTTAEDTWQGSITSGQQMESVKVPGSKHGQSPAKVVASDKAFTDLVGKTVQRDGKRVSAHADPRISPTSLVHAYHNEATIRAAQIMGRASGEIVPSVLAQEVPWTEVRRVAGKDEPYAARAAAKKTPKLRKLRPTDEGYQFSLF